MMFPNRDSEASQREINYSPACCHSTGWVLSSLYEVPPDKDPGGDYWTPASARSKSRCPKVDIRPGVEVDLNEAKITERAPAFRSRRRGIIVYPTKHLQ